MAKIFTSRSISAGFLRVSAGFLCRSHEGTVGLPDWPNDQRSLGANFFACFSTDRKLTKEKKKLNQLRSKIKFDSHAMSFQYRNQHRRSARRLMHRVQSGQRTVTAEC